MILSIDRESTTPLHRQISRGITHLIEQGVLPAGTRLPATRDLSRSLEVSRNTVIQAYQELEVNALIRSHVGRGAHVSGSPGARPQTRASPPFRLEGLFSMAWARSQSPHVSLLQQLTGGEIISLASLRPDQDLFPLEEFRDSIASAFRRYGADLLTVGAAQGFPPLLEHIPLLLAPRSIVCGVPNLMIVNGVQQALSLVGRLFIDPGDTVIMENLTYPGALSVFRSLQADCVGVPVDAEGISVDVLASVLQRRKAKLLYTIPTFQNPTGAVLTAERRRRLVELCREHGVLLVEDDYAHELAFAGREALPLKALDASGGVISLGSFSEALFPGIRLSWILADPRIIERLVRLKETSDLYTNRILQAALLEYCARGFYEKSLKRRKRILAARRDALGGALRNHMPAEASWRPPAGGSFQWVDLPPRLDALALLMETRKRGVTFAPDRMFSVDEWKRGGMRLGFSENEEGALVQGVRIIGEVMAGMLSASR